MNENLARENNFLREQLKREQNIIDRLTTSARTEIELENLDPIEGFKPTRTRIREAEAESRKKWEDIVGFVNASEK